MSVNHEQYSADTFVTLQGFERIRVYPSTIGLDNQSLAGHVQNIREPVDNSNDELKDIGGGRADIIFYEDKELGRYQVLVRDNGRGFPIALGKGDKPGKKETKKEAEERAFNTFLNSMIVVGHTAKAAGGDHVKVVNMGSSGQFGQGVKGTNATSCRAKGMSARIGQGYAMLDIYDGRDDNYNYAVQFDKKCELHGTIYAFEPDPKIMVGCPDHARSGEARRCITELIHKFSIFHRETIEWNIYYSPKLIPKKFWDMVDTPEAFRHVNDVIESGSMQRLFSTNDMVDKTTTELVTELWGNIGEPIWAIERSQQKGSHAGLSSSDITVVLSKPFTRSQNSLIMLNGVELMDNGNSAQTAIYKALKHYINPFLAENKQLQNWFNDVYRPPVHILANLRFDIMKFANSEKTNFNDKAREGVIKDTLIAIWSKEFIPSFWENLYTYLSDDIQQKYEAYYSKNTKGVPTDKGVVFQLNRPDSFYSCSVLGPESELFLVEGGSASKVANKRNMMYDAILALQGKIPNIFKSMKSIDDTVGAMAALNKSHIFCDMMRIIGVNPTHRTLDKMNYGAVTIMTDPDPDGHHINSLCVAGLYAINPLLITEGRVKVASPPLYAIYSGNNQKHKLYVQDKNELTAVRAKILYQPRVKIQVCFAGAQPIAPYEDAEYIRFCQVINSIAEHIYSASIKLNIPPDIIECIMKVTGYLRNVGPTKFAEELQNVLVGCKVEYDSLSDMIVILTSNLEEYSFALGGVLEELSRGLLADYRRCHFHEMGIIIEPVVDKTNVGPKHVTVSQLAGIFKRLDKLTNTKYFKGLGGMDVQQVYATCMDRKTRVCSDITSLGDVDNIFNFMGVDVRLRRAAMQRINS